MILPLSPCDPKPVRKARVAELHDLWLASGCNANVMLLLLNYRQQTVRCDT